MFDHYDKDYIIDFKVDLIGLEIQVTLLDLPCLLISCLQMVLYVY